MFMLLIESSSYQFQNVVDTTLRYNDKSFKCLWKTVHNCIESTDASHSVKCKIENTEKQKLCRRFLIKKWGKSRFQRPKSYFSSYQFNLIACIRLQWFMCVKKSQSTFEHQKIVVVHGLVVVVVGLSAAAWFSWITAVLCNRNGRMCVRLYAMEMVYVPVTVNKLTVSFIHLYSIFVVVVDRFEWAIVHTRRSNDELPMSDSGKKMSFRPMKSHFSFIVK